MLIIFLRNSSKQYMIKWKNKISSSSVNCSKMNNSNLENIVPFNAMLIYVINQ